MQRITHKLTTLTVSEKYFIERSIEILYRGTIDSYRVRVRNPKSILLEIKVAIEQFEKGEIKNFISIASKNDTTPALKEEAVTLCNLEPGYLVFDSFSKEYFLSVLNRLAENNFKQVKNCLSILLKENKNYISAVVNGLKLLLKETSTTDIETFAVLEKIDRTLNILFTELIDLGFSKEFLYRSIYAAFVNNLNAGDNFDAKFQEFEERIKFLANNYAIIFRIDTTNDINENIKSTIESMVVSDNIDDVNFHGNKEFELFKRQRTTSKFIKCHIESPDHYAALKKAKAILAENLDVLNLGYGDQYINIHSRVLVINNDKPEEARFQNSTNFIDGKYNVTKDRYLYFSSKVPIILSDTLVARESKEKIKSAIRYLRLGNQSNEVEHKFINYWIGLEYLFSNNDSYNTIARIKEYLVVCHSLIYVKRNLHYFFTSLSKIDDIVLATITHYNADPQICLANPNLYTEVAEKLVSTYPLLAERANNLSKKVSAANAKKHMGDYIKQHQKNLIIHLTRIYRLRNEIIHDAATNTNNENIAANLQYYLTFSLNGIIDYLCASHTEEVSIEDYFTLSEIHLGSIEHKGWTLAELLKVPSAIDFIS